jgi:predicted metalloendopeptidase
MYVLPWDDSIRAAQANETEYILNRTNYGKIIFKPKLAPTNSWTFPFVTGHKVKVHWSATGVDYERMLVERSEKWLETDKNVYVVHNFSDVRALMDVKIGNNQQFYQNNTLPSFDINYADFKTGQNMFYNESKREFHIVFNGKNATRTN